MAQIIDVNGELVEFPDEMTDEQIANAIKGINAPAQAAPTQPLGVQPQGIMQSLGLSSEQLQRQLGLTARGAITGITAPATAALDFLSGAYNVGANLLGSPSRMPLASEAQQQGMTQLGLPEPQGTLERAVQTGTSAMTGTGATAAMLKGVKGAAPLVENMFAQVPAAGLAGTTASAVGETTADITGSPLAGYAAALVTGGLAANLTSKALTPVGTPSKPTLSMEDIKTRAKQAYKTMENENITLRPLSVQSLFNKAEQELVKENFNPALDAHRPVAQVIQQVRDMAGNKRVSFTQLEQMRSAMNALKNDPNPATRKYAGQFVSEMDAYLGNISTKDVMPGTAGSAEKAAKAVVDARQDWRNMSRAGTIEDALNVAEAKALDPKASEGELIRRQLINLVANKNKMRVFSERERNAIKSVAKGPFVDPLLTLAARFNPERSQLMAGAQVAGAVANPLVAATVAGGGFAADKLQSLLRSRSANKLLSGIASGNLPAPVPNLAWRGMLSAGGVPNLEEQPQ